MRRVLLVLLLVVLGCESKKGGAGFAAGSGSGSGPAAGSGSSAGEVAKALDAKCIARDWESCRVLGVLFSEGAVVPVDAARSAALFLQACNGGNAAACNNL